MSSTQTPHHLAQEQLIESRSSIKCLDPEALASSETQLEESEYLARREQLRRSQTPFDPSNS